MLKNKYIHSFGLESLLILLFGLYFFLFFLFGSNSNTVIISEIAFFALIGVQSILIITNGKTTISKGTCLLIPFAFFLLVGILYAPDQNYALLIFQTYLILLFFLNFIINTINTRYLLERIILIVGFASLGISLYAINLYGLGFVINSILTGYRIGYEISQPNTLGYYSAIGFVIFLYYVIYNNKKLNKLFSIIFCLITLLVVLATVSRRALLICLLGFLLLLIYKRTKILGNKWIALVAISLLLITLIQIPQLEVFAERINSLTSLVINNEEGVNSSDLIRASLIQQGMNMFVESFFWGHGTGAFRHLAISFIGYEVASHNNYIEVLVNHGIIGFALYYLPIMYIAIKVWQRLKKNYDPIGLLILTLLICDIVIAGMTAYTYYSKISIFFYSLNIVYLVLTKTNRDSNLNNYT